MRIKDLGCFINISVSATELDSFADSWPCSGMRYASRGMTFQFDRRNGDLVEIFGQRKSYDEAAVLALSHDASNYAAKRLNAPQLAR